MTQGRKKKWFGVKTLYRTRTIGRPNKRDRHYDPEATLVEERIILVRANGFDRALKAARRDALTYTRNGYRNLYGQKVETTFLDAWDAFELFDPPGTDREVYSRTEIVSRGISNSTVVKQLMGPSSVRGEQYIRRKFLNRMVSSKLWPDA
jgi:hypothetical protein